MPTLGNIQPSPSSQSHVDQMQHLLTRWGECRHMRHPQVIVGFDTNETFDFDVSDEGRVTVLTELQAEKPYWSGEHLTT